MAKRNNITLIGYKGFRKIEDKWHEVLHDDGQPGLFDTIAEARTAGATKCRPSFQRSH